MYILNELGSHWCVICLRSLHYNTNVLPFYFLAFYLHLKALATLKWSHRWISAFWSVKAWFRSNLRCTLGEEGRSVSSFSPSSHFYPLVSMSLKILANTSLLTVRSFLMMLSFLPCAHLSATVPPPLWDAWLPPLTQFLLWKSADCKALSPEWAYGGNSSLILEDQKLKWGCLGGRKGQRSLLARLE